MIEGLLLKYMRIGPQSAIACKIRLVRVYPTMR